VVVSYPGSTSADGAQYYVGRTLQQQAAAAKVVADAAAALAGTASDYTGVGGYLDLTSQARAELQKMVTLYPQSSLADNAQYQIGKTYYDVGTDYASARAELKLVIDNYPASTYADNAQYYIGRAYHKDPSALNYLVEARTAYGLVLSAYPTSTKVENAEYYSARTYHDEGNCALELSTMQAFEVKYPASAHLATVQTHIADLLLAPSTVTHVCI